MVFSTTGAANLANNIITTNDALTIGGALVIAEAKTVTLDTGAGAGDITLSSTVNGTAGGATESLNLDAGTGDIIINGEIGGVTVLGTLTLGAAATVDINADVTAGIVDVSGTITEIDLAQDVDITATTGNLDLATGVTGIDLSAAAGTNIFTSQNGGVSLAAISDSGTPVELEINTAEGLSLGVVNIANLLDINLDTDNDDTITYSSNAITAGELTIDGGTDNNDTLTVGGAINVAGSVDINIGTLNLNQVLNTTNNGTVTITNTGAATVSSKITSERKITFDGAGVVILGADMETTDSGAGNGIEITTSTLQLSGDYELRTNIGDITLDQITTAIANDHVLTLTTYTGNPGNPATLGQIQFNDDIGSVGTPLGGLVIDNADGVDFETGAPTYVNYLTITDIYGMSVYEPIRTYNTSGTGNVSVTSLGSQWYWDPIISNGDIYLSPGNNHVGVVDNGTYFQTLNAGDTIELATGDLFMYLDFALTTNNGDITLNEVYARDTVDGTVDLTLTAGTGNVLINSVVGDDGDDVDYADTELDDLVIVSATNVTFSGADADIYADKIMIDATGLVRFDGDVNTVATGGYIDIDTATLDLNAVMNANDNGTVTITNSGTADIGAMITSERTVLFDGTGGINLGSDIEVTDSGYALTVSNSAISLTGGSTLTTNAGTITLGSTVNGNQAFSVQAGAQDVNITGVIGGTTGLASLDIDGNDITLNSIGDSDTVGVVGITAIDATGTIVFTGDTYKANQQTYTASAGNTFLVNAANDTTFTSSDDSITFTTGTIKLADGSDLIITSAGGAITTGAIEGTSSEDVTISSTTGTTNTITVGAIGVTTDDGINTVAVTATSNITLNGNIYTSNAAGNTVTITGPVTLGTNVTIDTAEAANDGTVNFTSTINGANTLTVNTDTASITFGGAIGGTTPITGLTITDANNVSFDGAVSVNGNFEQTAGTGTTTFTGGTTVDIDGNFTLGATSTVSADSSTIEVEGNWANSGTFTCGTGTVTLDGTTSTTLVSNGSDFCNLKINKTDADDADDNVTLTTDDIIVTNSLTITDGELVQGALNITTGAVSVAAAGKWSNISTGDVTLSGDVNNAGTITFNSSDDAGNGIVLRSSADGTQRDWQGDGTVAMTDVNVKDQIRTSGTPSYITVTSGTDAGNNVNWFFSGSESIAGTVYQTVYGGADTVTAAAQDMVLYLYYNSGSSLSMTATAGAGTGIYTFAGLDLTSGDIATVYINDDDHEATTSSRMNGSNVAGFNVYKNTVVLRAETGALSNANLSSADDGDNDIKYNVSGSDLTVDSGFDLVIWTGDTFTPGGNVTVSADWVNEGTFTSGSNTVSLTGAAAQDVTAGGDSFSTVNISKSGGSVTFTDSVTTTTLVTNAANYAISFEGASNQVTDDATFNNTGALTLGNGSGDSITFVGGLDTTATSGTSVAGTVQTTNTDIDLNNLTLTADATLSTAAGAGTINLNGTVNGDYKLTLTAGTGNVDFDATVGNLTALSGLTVTGAANVTFDNTVAVDNEGIDVTATAVTFSNTITTTNSGDIDITNSGAAALNGTVTCDGNLTLDGAGTTTLGAAVDAEGNVSVSNGTFNAAGYGIALEGNWTVDVGAVYTSGNNIVTFDGIAKQTITAGGTDADHDFNDVTYSGTNELELAGNIVINNNFNLTGSGDVDCVTYDLTIGGNLDLDDGTFNTDGNDSGDWDIAGTVDVSGDAVLIATSGTFTVAGNWTVAGTADFTSGNNNVTFDGAADQTITTGGDAFYNLTITNTGGSGSDDIIISGALDVNGTLTITNGDLDIGTNDPTVNTAGDLTIAADGSIDVTGRTADWTFDGTSVFTDSSAGQDIEDVRVNGTSLTLASDMYVQTIDVDAGTFDVGDGGYTLTIDGTGTPMTITGTFDDGTNSKVLYTGATATNIAAATYHDLEVNADTTFTLLNTTNVTGALTVTDGTLVVGARTLNVTENVTNNDTITISTGTLDVDGDLDVGTLTATGAASINVAGNWSGVDVYTSGSSVVTFDGGATSTINSGGTTANYDFTRIDITNGTTLQALTNNLKTTTLNVTNGSLDMAANDLTLEVTGVLTVSAGASYLTGTTDQVIGTLTNSGMVTCEGAGADGSNLQITTMTNNDGSLWNYTSGSGTVNVKQGTYHDLTVNDSNGTAVYALSAGGDTDVTGTLTVTGGNLTIGARTLNVTENVVNDDTITISTGTFDVEGNLDVGTLTVTDAGSVNLAGNWLGMDTFTSGTGTVTFDGTGAQAITTNGDAFNNVTIDNSGAGVVSVSAGTLNIDGNFLINDADAAFTALNAGTMTVGGNWTNTGGTFTANSGTVVIDGTGTTAFSGATTFYNFSCVSGGKTLQFTNTAKQTIGNSFILTGTAGTLILVRSASDGNAAEISVDGSKAQASYVDVKDSNNSSGTDIVPTLTVNRGNNTGWDFSNSYILWTGTVDTNWNVAGNWSAGVVPGDNDNIWIENVTNDPIMQNDEIAAKLVVSNGILEMAGYSLTVTTEVQVGIGTLTNSTGNMSITTGTMTSGGTINCTSGNIDFDVTNTLTLEGAITTASSNGNVDLSDCSDINLGADSSITTGSAGGNITIGANSGNTVDGAFDLTLTAGTGVVTINSTIGGGAAIKDLTIVSAQQVDVNNVTVTDGSIDITATNIDLNGTTYTSTTDDITLTGGVDLVGATVTLTAGGGAGDDVAITGTITGTDNDLTITANNGTVSVDVITAVDDLVITASTINLGGNVTTSDAAGNSVTFTGAVTLQDNISIDTDHTTNDGNVIFNGAGTIGADAAANERTLTIAAGTADITIGGAVGGSEALNTFTITSADDVDIDAVTTREGGVTVVTSGANPTVTLNGNISTDAGTNAGDVSVTGPVTLGGGVAIDTDHATGTDGDITFSTTVDGAQSLQLTAGTGDISFGGAIGSSVNLTGLTVTTCDDVSYNSTTAVAGNIDINCATVTIPGTMTTTNNGTVTVTNSGVATVDAKITGDRTITFDGAGTINLGADMQVSDAGYALTINSSAVNLTSASTLTTNAGVITLGGTVNGAYDFSVQAGLEDVTVSGVIGGTTALTSLDIDGNDITLNSIGDSDTVGVTGNTTITAVDNGGDTGSITFTGTTYKANSQVYTAPAGNTFLVNAGAETTFTSSDDAISFVTGTVKLADGSDLVITSAGGAVSIGAIEGTSSEDVTITAQSGTTNTVTVGAIGAVTDDGINTVVITGTSGVTLNGDIYTSNSAGNTVTITGPVTLGGNTVIDTAEAANDGAISFTSTIDGAVSLTVNSDTASITFGGAIGAVTPLTGLTITDADNVTFGAGVTINGNLIQSAGTGTTTFADASTVDVNGNISIPANVIWSAGSSTIQVEGSWTNSGTFTAGTGTVTFDGTTSLTLDTEGDSFYNLVINKTAAANADDNVTLANSDLVVTNSLTITDGELIQGALNITTGTVSVSSAGKWTNISTGDLTLSGDLSNAGTITFDSSDNGDGITIVSSVDGTRRNWQGAGTFTMTDVQVKDQKCIGGTPNRMAVTSGTDNGNNVNWLFDHLGTSTVSGSLYDSVSESTAIGSTYVFVGIYDASRGVVSYFADQTDGNGAYSSVTHQIDTGDVVTGFLDELANEATAVTKAAANGSDITGLTLHYGVVDLYGESVALTNADLGLLDSPYDDDIKYTESAGDLTVTEGFALRINSGKTFTPGGDIIVNGDWINRGTFTSGSNTVTFSGSANQSVRAGGSDFSTIALNKPSGAVTFTDNVNIDTIVTDTANKGGSIYFNGTQTVVTDDTIFENTGTVGFGNGEGDTINFAAGVDTTAAGMTNIAGTLQTTNVDIDLSAVTLTADVTVTTGAGAGNITFNSTIDGNYELSLTAGTGNVTFNGAAGAVTALSGVTVSSTDTITINGLLRAGSGGLTFTVDTITVPGTLTTVNGGDITLVNSGSSTFTGAVNASGDLLLNGAGQVTMNAAVDVDGDLSVPAGATFDAGDSRISIGGDWLKYGSVSTGGASFRFDDATKISHIIGSNSFGALVVDTPGKIVIFPAGSFQDINRSLQFANSGGAAMRFLSTVPGQHYTITPNGSADLSGPMYMEDGINGTLRFIYNHEGIFKHCVRFATHEDQSGGNEVPPPPKEDLGGDGDPEVSINLDDGFNSDISDSAEQEEDRMKKTGKYRTVVIVFEGKVVVTPYDKDGVHHEREEVVRSGERVMSESSAVNGEPNDTAMNLEDNELRRRKKEKDKKKGKVKIAFGKK